MPAVASLLVTAPADHGVTTGLREAGGGAARDRADARSASREASCGRGRWRAAADAILDRLSGFADPATSLTAPSPPTALGGVTGSFPDRATGGDGVTFRPHTGPRGARGAMPTGAHDVLPYARATAVAGARVGSA